MPHPHCVLAAALLAATSVPAFAGPDVYAVTTANRLVRFGAATPGTITDIGAVTGLPSGQNISSTILSIDFRPSTSTLYAYVEYHDDSALVDENRLYTINTATGVATFATNVGEDPIFDVGGPLGCDFDPVIDRLRVVNEDDFNIRVNPETGTAVAGGELHFAAGDTNEGDDPRLSAAAHTNSRFGATAASTALYAIDMRNFALVSVNPIADGTLTTIGGLAIPNPQLDIATDADFDIFYDGSANTAYAAIEWNSLEGVVTTNLYTINLTTGAATLVGEIPDIRLRGMSVIPAPATLPLACAGLVAASRRRRRAQ